MNLTQTFLLFIFNVIVLFSEGHSFNIVFEELSIGKSQFYSLNNTLMLSIGIRNIPDDIVRAPPKVFITCDDCEEENPLQVVVTQNKDVQSWELPLVFESNDNHSLYKTAKRTLCPYDILIGPSSFSSTKASKTGVMPPVILSLNTMSSNNVLVELLVDLEENFVLNLHENKSVEVSPSAPTFFLYEFTNLTSVFLHVTSDDDTCLILSVQNVSCPVFDLEENVRYKGFFQTVTKQGGLTLTKETFPNGFYVVLVVNSDDKPCSSRILSNTYQRKKSVVITLSENLSHEEFVKIITITLVIILVICVGLLIFFWMFETKLSEVANFRNLSQREETQLPLPGLQNSSDARSNVNTATEAGSGDNIINRTSEENDNDVLRQLTTRVNFRGRVCLKLCDLATNSQAAFKEKSRLYLWNLITVAIFYSLPALQLVFHNQNVSKQYGHQDMCYYNFLCSYPVWYFNDFNHMFSNIGYFCFGLLFMCITYLKEKDYQKKISNSREHISVSYGIPQHFGIFYAMGAALITEGVLSTVYHICPNHYNFQFEHSMLASLQKGYTTKEMPDAFRMPILVLVRIVLRLLLAVRQGRAVLILDTSFMYVLCTICLVKMYHARHPDINANAYATFFLLAWVAILGFYGVIDGGLTFWIIFTCVHLLTCIYLSLQIYFLGNFKLRKFREYRCFRAGTFTPIFPRRFALLFLANIANWIAAAVPFIFELNNFASHLLVIFILNLLLYGVFYFCMKFICGENLTYHVATYLILSIILWVSALYFFFCETVSWQFTPAESKLLNQECVLVDFFDNHDIWHFISAVAMFFSFMVLLTLDDDLIYTSRSEISVF